MKKLLLAFIITCSTLVSAQDPMFDICPIKNSEEIPEATIYSTSGEAVELKEYIGEKPVVLVFFRGGWCPYCIRHLSALNEVKTSIDSLGFELMAITPDDYTRLDSSIIRSGVIDYKLFSDKDIEAINAFGIGWQVNEELYQKYKDSYNIDLEWWNGTSSHILPVPSVYIITEGKIQYQHVDPNYSRRLSPEILLAYLNELTN